MSGTTRLEAMLDDANSKIELLQRESGELSSNCTAASRRVGDLNNELHDMRVALEGRADEMDGLAEEIVSLKAKLAAAEAAIKWALGEGDSDFGNNVPAMAGKYWWRPELRKRAAIDTTKPVDPARAIFEDLQRKAIDAAKTEVRA